MANIDIVLLHRLRC